MPAATMPLAPVEAVASYARRVGDDVRLVVVLSGDLADVVGDGLATSNVWVRLAHQGPEGREGFRVPAQVTPGPRPVVEATVPWDRLSPDTWDLLLRVGQGGPLVRLEARLLVTDPAVQPIALLVGPPPRTRMEPPEPR